MAKPAAPTQLVTDVKDAIRFMSPTAHDDIADTDSLETRWRLFATNRKALAPPFQRIARNYDRTAKLTQKQCAALTTVKKAVQLVAKVAGFSYE